MILSLLAFKKKENPGISDDAIVLYREELLGKTMGHLLGLLKQHCTLPLDLRESLDGILVNRNIIAHHFFRQYFQQLTTPDGRKFWVTQLDALFDIVADATEDLEKLT